VRPTSFTNRYHAAAALKRLRGPIPDRVQQRVADDLDWSLAKMIRIENGATRLSMTDASALLTYYGADDGTREAVLAQAKASKVLEWWDLLPRQVPSIVRTMLAWEASAAHLVDAQARHVPVLLQTAAYHRALRPVAISEPYDQQLADTILDRRQEILRTPHGRQLRFLLDEAVLWRSPGTTATLLDQLDRLIDLATLEHVPIAVVPLVGLC
jgi:hypothetical protein